MSNAEQVNWLNSMTWQVDIYCRSGHARRKDPEFDWETFMRSPSGRLPETKRLVRTVLHKLGLRDRPILSLEWLHENAGLLWDTRTILAVYLSRLLYDSSLVLRLTNFQHHYFPRIDFDDLIEIVAEIIFDKAGFPHDYIGMPLGVFDIRLRDRSGAPILKGHYPENPIAAG